MKTIVDLPASQAAALSEFCQSQGISEAEAISRAVTRLLEAPPADEAQLRDRAFGAWRKTELTSATHVRRMREEWEQ